MSRLVVFIIIAVSFYAITHFSGGNVGMSSQCINDQCIISVSSSLLSVVFGLFFALFVLFFKQCKHTTDIENVVGVWRRFGAFFIDYAAVLLALSPVMSLPLLISEANHTGNFQWSFYREFSRDSDQIFLLPAILGIFICLILYFYKYSIVERQTLGEYISGYKIVPTNENETPSYLKRVFLSFIGLCIWPISIIFALRNETKQFWWDNSCNTHAVRVKATNKSLNLTGAENTPPG